METRIQVTARVKLRQATFCYKSRQSYEQERFSWWTQISGRFNWRNNNLKKLGKERLYILAVDVWAISLKMDQAIKRDWKITSWHLINRFKTKPESNSVESPKNKAQATIIKGL
ncbi:hypothetical protein ACROYT_G013349 [Oculina patagonica]